MGAAAIGVAMEIRVLTESAQKHAVTPLIQPC